MQIPLMLLMTMTTKPVTAKCPTVMARGHTNSEMEIIESTKYDDDIECVPGFALRRKNTREEFCMVKAGGQIINIKSRLQ